MPPHSTMFFPSSVPLRTRFAMQTMRAMSRTTAAGCSVGNPLQNSTIQSSISVPTARIGSLAIQQPTFYPVAWHVEAHTPVGIDLGVVSRCRVGNEVCSPISSADA